MTTRSDVNVEYNTSPRIAEISDTSTEIIMQDVVDTLRKHEDSFQGIPFKKLLNASGKEDLGGGVTVGITVALQNLKLAFKGRTTPAETGSITGTPTSPIVGQQIMQDSSATFITNNVNRGSLLINFTDNSIADVISVDSETQLTTKTLINGIGNTYDISDVYHVFNIVQVSASGGNLTAVDSNQSTISPILATAFTQVLLTSSSSATLQELSSIQYSSFNAKVTLDVINGTDGTDYPTGTPLQPVKTLDDAKLIATERGFDTISIIGDYTFLTTDVLDGFVVVGQNPQKTKITLTTEAIITNCEFRNADISGFLDGGTTILDSHIGNLDYIDGDIQNCELELGTIILSGASAEFINCYSGVPGLATPTIDMGGSGTTLVIRNYQGGIKLINKTGTDAVSIDMSSGHVILDSTVTTGIVVLRGLAKLTDNSTGTAQINSADLLVPSRLTNMQFLIETSRPHHTGTGEVWYWDPYGGDDTQDGRSISTASKTFAHIHDNLVKTRRHDIIFCIPGDPSGSTITTEKISITKDYLLIRGLGKDFHIHPTTNNPSNAVIDISGTGIEISGIHIKGSDAPAGSDGIYVSGNFTLLKDLWVNDTLNDGIILDGAEDFTIENAIIGNHANHGINIKNNTLKPTINNCHIEENGADGIHLEGTGINELYIKGFCIIHGSGAYGLNIGSNVLDTRIGEFASFEDNVSGNILDNGTDTGNQAIIKRTLQTDSVLDTSLTSHNIINSLALETKDARKVSTNKALITDIGGGIHDIKIYDDDGITLLYNWTVSADKLTKTKL